MKTSPEGVKFITDHEGVVLKTYFDSAGVATIGVGHTAAAGPPTPVKGMTITRKEAEAILARDLAKFEARVANTLGNVPQHVFDGAVSFDFNTGSINKASWVKKFMRGDIDGARGALALWNKAGGKVLSGLTRRRAEEARLIFDGDYGFAVKKEASPNPVGPIVGGGGAATIGAQLGLHPLWIVAIGAGVALLIFLIVKATTRKSAPGGSGQTP